MALIQVKSNDEIEQDKEKEVLEGITNIVKPVSLDSLVGYVISAWDEARTAKDTIEDEMRAFLKQRNGEYPDSKLAEMRKYGGSQIFMRLTDEKCTAAKAWINEIVLDDPFGIEPTPLPDLPEAVDIEIEKQVMQEFQADIDMGLVDPNLMEARARELKYEIQDKTYNIAREEEKRVETKLKDLMVEGGFHSALKDVVEDIVDLHIGILKGPIIKKERTLAWDDSTDGNFRPTVQDKFVVKYERVSPFDLYPSPVATDVNDGYLIQKHRLTRASLQDMKGVPGYIDSNIDKVLEEHNEGRLSNWLDSVETAYGTTFEQEKDKQFRVPSIDAKIEAIQFWGRIQGKKLKEYEVAGLKDLDSYEAEVWVIGRHVIKAELNGDKLGRRPYYKASFRERNGSFWGVGLPETIYDIQDMVNAAARNLVNNMGYASSPQTGIDISRLAEGENPEGLRPGRMWQFDESLNTTSGGRQPIWFFQPKALVGELVRTYEFFSNEADNKTGIPRYSYGSGGSTGALGTATGMSMMMSNASRGIKQVISNIDYGIMQQSVSRLYEWVLMYGNEEAQFPVDINIIAKGSSALLAKEQQQVRRNEFLQLSMNPIVMDIIGKKGMANILRTVSKGLDFGPNDVVPTASEIERQEFQQQLMQQQMMEQQLQMAEQEQQAKGPDTMPDGAVAGGKDANAFPQGRV